MVAGLFTLKSILYSDTIDLLQGNNSNNIRWLQLTPTRRFMQVGPVYVHPRRGSWNRHACIAEIDVWFKCQNSVNTWTPRLIWLQTLDWLRFNVFCGVYLGNKHHLNTSVSSATHEIISTEIPDSCFKSPVPGSTDFPFWKSISVFQPPSFHSILP